MWERIKFIKMSSEVPDTGFLFLEKSLRIPGFFYIISKEDFEEATKFFEGGVSESELLMQEDSGLWLSSFFDISTFEKFEDNLISHLGSEQNVVNLLSLNSNVTEEMLSERRIVTEKQEDFVEEFVDDSDEIMKALEGSSSEDQEEVEVEDSPITLSEFSEIQSYLRDIESRELYSVFIGIVCSFSDDLEVCDEVLREIYQGILKSFESALKFYESDTLSFYGKIVSKFLEESED